ncbi:hypothetical protein ACSBR1_011317 [Camellia fascicularis]
MKTHDIVFAQRPYSFASRILSYNSQNIAFSPVWQLLEANAKNLAAFRGKTKSQEEFVSIVEEVADLIGGFTIVDMYPSVKLFQVSSGIRGTLEKMHKRFDQILENIVNEHRERKRITESGKGEEEDLVDVLLRIQKHGDLEFPLTDNNIKAVILSDLFCAIPKWEVCLGMKFSRSPVFFYFIEFLAVSITCTKCGKRDITNDHRLGNVRNAEKPQVMKRAQAETLRLHPSAPLLVPRESSEQCTINGYDIPAKTKVIVNAWAIGQDPKYWNEAEKFDPERFLDSEIDFKGRDFEFIPFGAGRRICPGYRLRFLILSFNLHSCCIILIGNSLMERSMKN